jgi:hypothetical protein
MTHQLQRLNYSHEALVSQIIANPTATNAELGAIFGRTKEWVGMVKNSGIFREKLLAKMAEVTDPLLAASIEERLEMVTKRTLEVLHEKMARPVDQISDELAIQAANFGAKGMGIGGFASRPIAPPPAPQLDRIERLADRLINLNRPSVPHQEITDVEVRNVG